MATITIKDLTQRTLDAIPGGRQQFSIIILWILEGIVSGVVSYFVDKCIHWIDPSKLKAPNRYERWLLRRRVKSFCAEYGKTSKAKQARLDGSMLYSVYGDRLYNALLQMAAGLTQDDLVALKASLS